MPKFKVGDIVQLKSGGPKMTVVELPGAGWIDDPRFECSWIDARGKPQTRMFPADALVPAQKEAEVKAKRGRGPQSGGER